ncbi:MAG: tryptophan--tRNA ligase [Candidatus Kryptoniota bacterium]
MSNKKIILSGMRPTGKLHLGHWAGALESWVQLQNEGNYQNYHLIADYHALTTNLDTSKIYEYTIDMLVDWVSAGIDPEQSPVFRQSQVKQHTELHLIFSMLITKSRLERNPTLKEQVRDLNLGPISYGYLGYPVLQAADILLYKGEVVPVGEDQLSHIEITREIARDFNRQYKNVFPEPEPRLTRFARLPGLDGKKMSKSLNNSIFLSDSEADVVKKMKKAVTDPRKIRKGDPGRPDICLVFTYHKKFNAIEEKEIRSGCESGKLGCVECKMRCAASINKFLMPFRERRARLEQNPEEVRAMLQSGEEKARVKASETMQQVHEAMKMG